MIILFGQFFYRSWIATAILTPLFFPFYLSFKKKKEKRNCHELGNQFRDAILSVSASQKAGYSIENAFIAARKDMIQLHGKNSVIDRELLKITKGLANNIVLEKMLYELGERSRNADIREFAQVFAVAKRSGGNMTETMAGTIELIGKRMEVENEIEVLISARRMEARIMEAVPFGIVFYIELTNRGFFAPLYHNPAGIFLMTVCMTAYIAAYLMTERIIEIEV
ncbi:MAG: hypothetical protein LKF52_09445 [Butyrivibrio sp.]|nr:hypothetical protein [Butyrivibrio sp.]